MTTQTATGPMPVHDQGEDKTMRRLAPHLPKMAAATIVLPLALTLGLSSVASAASSSSGSSGTRSFPGASGSVAAITGTSMEVQNQQSGQVTVSWTTTTDLHPDGQTSPPSSVAVGDCVTVSGSTAKKTKVVTAKTVTVSQPTVGEVHRRVRRLRRHRAAASGGGSGRTAQRRELSRLESRGVGPPERFPGGGSGRRPGVANGGFASGKVTAVTSSSLTVSGFSSASLSRRDPARRPRASVRPSRPRRSTVAVTSSTTYSESQSAASSTLAVGDCVTAAGSTDSTGAVTATAVHITSTGGKSCTIGVLRSRGLQDRPMPEPARRSWRLLPRWLIAVAVVIVGLGTGIGLWATGASAVSGYRIASETTASVSKTLDVTGTASPVHQATAEFQVAGTVSAVDVSLNQQVTAGQTLASLSTTSLEKDVSSAQTTLTAAEAKLSEDESSQSSSTSTVVRHQFVHHCHDCHDCGQHHDDDHDPFERRPEQLDSNPDPGPAGGRDRTTDRRQRHGHRRGGAQSSRDRLWGVVDGNNPDDNSDHKALHNAHDSAAGVDRHDDGQQFGVDIWKLDNRCLPQRPRQSPIGSAPGADRSGGSGKGGDSAGQAPQLVLIRLVRSGDRIGE